MPREGDIHSEADSNDDVERQSELDEYQKAMSAISRGLRPDPITGEIETADIIRYINTHIDDPNVKKFLSESTNRQRRVKEERRRALATFDVNRLHVEPRSAWLVSLEYSGLTTDPRLDDTWDIPGSSSAGSSSNGGEAKDEPQQTFQLFCYIRDGPGEEGGDNSRHIEEFVGLPTSQQIENFIKLCMAKPLECFEPFIPTTLAFSQNLAVHEAALKPFLNTLPWPCTAIFETPEIRRRMQDQAFAYGEKAFRDYIAHANELKEAGNVAYTKGKRSEAVAKYQEGADLMESLLFRKLSDEGARDLETRKLLAVCLANCAVARLMEVPGEQRDAEGARKDAEGAIKADPDYAKGYLRLSRAQEALGNLSAAQDALVRGLRQKSLKEHWGLADHLILLQTGGNGLPKEKVEFDKWLKNVLEVDQVSAVRMSNIDGAWKRRCDDHAKTLTK
ncbi:hypothetical protein GALMADRAFT_116635 [Galerina marginata CBS 339.88]|uniref:Uncharacterized protein n=1 Tax=Galerina marginata (strain CBS 339.88) TaxID=685588 RepID=A0A067TJH4_GALM3|nr:hypothetical protein GALMADRAFT_116635 [Galerina marginata CBS 339.88]